jgi:hypothetical protein
LCTDFCCCGRNRSQNFSSLRLSIKFRLGSLGHRYGSLQKAMLFSSRHVASTPRKTDKTKKEKYLNPIFLLWFRRPVFRSIPHERCPNIFLKGTNSKKHLQNEGVFCYLCPWQESNLHREYRKLEFYPLNYKSIFTTKNCSVFKAI